MMDLYFQSPHFFFIRDAYFKFQNTAYNPEITKGTTADGGVCVQGKNL
jgi:hypothetical protein